MRKLNVSVGSISIRCRVRVDLLCFSQKIKTWADHVEDVFQFGTAYF